MDLAAALTMFTAVPLLDGSRTAAAFGYALVMLGLAAFSGAMREWTTARGCDAGLIRLWDQAAKVAWANVVVFMAVDMVVLLSGGSDPFDLQGWPALLAGPLVIFVGAPYLVAFLASLSLKAGFARQQTSSRPQPV